MSGARFPANRDADAAAPADTKSPTDNSRSAPGSLDAIQEILVAMVADELGMRPGDIDPQAALIAYGLDSLSALSLATEVEERLGYTLPPTVLHDHPSIAALAGYLAGQADATADESEMAVLEIPPEVYRVELFPEYRSLRRRIELGLGDLYFLAHTGVAGATIALHGRELINYASYNYLGLSGDPVVSRAAHAAIERYGTSASASRLVAGELPLHRELERALADLVGAADCIAYVSGHATNVTTIGHLLGPGDLIVHDALIHNSAL